MRRISLRNFVKLLAVTAVVALLIFSSAAALAQRAGYDLMQTGPGAAINLSSVPGMSPAVVELKGVPICACTGATDTIMYRTHDVPPGGGAVPLQIVALFLKNSGPVSMSGHAVDVYITVNHSNGVIGQETLPMPDSLPDSTGTLTIRTNGTFDSSFTVHSDVIVVAAGADVRNPATHLAHRAAPAVTLGATNSTWSTIPPIGYPNECFFPANGFYPGGPVPEAAPAPGDPHQHPVTPSGPPEGGNGARCLSFNPATTHAESVGGRWKVVDNGHYLFDFDSQAADATKAVAVIQHYHANEYCTVGSTLPDEQTPPYAYLLVSGASLVGNMAGEDCIGFNTATVTVQDISGRWTITDGSQLMYNFGPQKTAANQALAIIKGFHSTLSCFVGRPETSTHFVLLYSRSGGPIFKLKVPPQVEFKKVKPGEPVEEIKEKFERPAIQPVIKK